MNLGQAYFWICAALAVIGAISTVASKNPIRGAMGLLMMVLSVAGLFLALHAQFLAAIQLIVYAGAIVVLFLFVIMLIGPSANTPSDRRGLPSRAIGALAFGLGGVGAMTLLVRAGLQAAAANPGAGTVPPVPPTDFGGIDAVGRVLFTQGLVPFELSSALLMVAIVGAIAVARGKQASPSTSSKPAIAAATASGKETDS
ncbi:MAG: NADH-quinone oxidoreductase subunit J [Myxococcales bacterium]|nr:NADH-quinone oxidoreductase subunit J [Myxococcales bacterium]